MTVTAAMDSATSTGMDGATTAPWQWKMHRRYNATDHSNGDGGNGQCNGNGDGWHDGNATVAMVMEGATATAVDSDNGNAMATTAMDGNVQRNVVGRQ